MAGSEIDPAPPLNSRAANFAVVERIRDLVKWLIVIFGAIGGVLLTGLQISNLDQAHGCDRTIAIVAIGVGALAAAAAIAAAIAVLLPIGLLPADLKKSKKIRERIEDEPGLLPDNTNHEAAPVAGSVPKDPVETLLEVREETAKVEHEAWEAHRADPTNPDLEAAFNKAKAVAERPDDAVQRLMSFLLADKVKQRMIWATVGIFLGGAVVVTAAIFFVIHTNKSDNPSLGDIVPKRLSAVVVRLTPAGREDLADNLGRRCATGRLRAIAIGGPPDDLGMITVPSTRCRAARFVLSPGIGAVVNGKRLRALRACALPRPWMPCVVYPNSAALVAAEP